MRPIIHTLFVMALIFNSGVATGVTHEGSLVSAERLTELNKLTPRVTIQAVTEVQIRRLHSYLKSRGGDDQSVSRMISLQRKLRGSK